MKRQLLANWFYLGLVVFVVVSFSTFVIPPVVGIIPMACCHAR